MTNTATTILKASLRRTLQVKSLLALALLGIGVLLIFFFSKGLPRPTEITVRVFGTMAGMSGLFIFMHVFRNLDVGRALVVRQLEEEPQDVVWVYHYITVNMPWGIELFRIITLHIHLADGSKHAVFVKNDRLKELLGALQSLLPHATFGYSAEREQLFRANPELLRKEP